MCKCTPEIRTPFCGKPGCEWPKKRNAQLDKLFGQPEPTPTDPLYGAAVALVRLFDKASTSFLQRKFNIPYDRAVRIMEQMQAADVVTARDSDGARRVVQPLIKGGISLEPPPFPGVNGAVSFADYQAEVERRRKAEADLAALTAQINAPVVDDWFAGVRNEAVHQQQRWGAEHDAGKSPLDWFWLIGYLAQKAAFSAIAGDHDKAKHHTISTGAALLNWWRQIDGLKGGMRPGIEPPIGVADPVNEEAR